MARGGETEKVRERESFDFSTLIVKFVFFSLTLGFIAFFVFGIYLLIIPFGISMILALALSPLINHLERYNIPRIAGTLLVIGGLVAVGYLLYLLLFPVFSAEIAAFEKNIDQYKISAIKKWGQMLFIGKDVIDMLRSYGAQVDDNTLAQSLEKVFKNVSAALKKAGEGAIKGLPTLLTHLLITPIITFVFLLQGGTIYRNILAMVPNRYFEMTLLLAKKIQEQINSYLKGLFIQWLILLVINCVGLSLIGLPYGIPAGFIAASVNIVPYLGPLIGLVPAVILAVLYPGGDILVPTLLVLFSAQLVDNLFTQPVVLARSVQVHPIISILAVVTAISLNSMFMILIAIPLAGILLLAIQVMYRSLKAFRMI